MIRAQLVTAWVGTGVEGDPFRPAVIDSFAVRSWRDVTGQPSTNLIPEPNAFTVEVTCDEAALEAIVAAGYVVLWSESA